jgi:hypothetical protein
LRSFSGISGLANIFRHCLRTAFEPPLSAALTHLRSISGVLSRLFLCCGGPLMSDSFVFLRAVTKTFSHRSFNPEIPLKDLKSSMEISDHTKSKIFENRMDNAAYKLNRVANELDREKHEKEMLKKKLTEKYVAHNRTAFGSFLFSFIAK